MASEERPVTPVIVQPQARAGIVAEISGGLLDTFKTLPPVLMILVLLNMCFAGVGGYYLLRVEEYRANDRKATHDLLAKCLTETVHIDFLKANPKLWTP